MSGRHESAQARAIVGRRVRSLRQTAGLNQQDLADAAGVSRRTVISVEAGESNIGLSTLDDLAAALGVGFVDLVVTPAESEEDIGAVMWTGSTPNSHATLSGRAPARSEGQLWLWSLGPRESYHAEPDPAGWYEMTTLISGRLLVRTTTRTYELDTPGNHAIYSSAQRYDYVSDSDEVCTFSRVVLS